MNNAYFLYLCHNQSLRVHLFSSPCDFLADIFTPGWVDHSGIIYKCFPYIILTFWYLFCFKVFVALKGRNTISTVASPQS